MNPFDSFSILLNCAQFYEQFFLVILGGGKRKDSKIEESLVHAAVRQVRAHRSAGNSGSPSIIRFFSSTFMY